jgi:hypothetical protein
MGNGIIIGYPYNPTDHSLAGLTYRKSFELMTLNLQKALGLILNIISSLPVNIHIIYIYEKCNGTMIWFFV